jgi:hypothetical protein
VVDAAVRNHRNYWITIFDALIDKRLVGPLAPNTQAKMPDMSL